MYRHRELKIIWGYFLIYYIKHLFPLDLLSFDVVISNRMVCSEEKALTLLLWWVFEQKSNNDTCLICLNILFIWFINIPQDKLLLSQKIYIFQQFVNILAYLERVSSTFLGTPINRFQLFKRHSVPVDGETFWLVFGKSWLSSNGWLIGSVQIIGTQWKIRESD